MAYVYLIKSLRSNWVYVGSTNDVETRFHQYNLGQVTSTKGRLPYRLIHVEEYKTIKEARVREKEIKQNRILKESLVRKFK
ncbi:MAG: GIY-YIG nuclease family protein [Patescibacteria group bacterium]